VSVVVVAASEARLHASVLAVALIAAFAAALIFGAGWALGERQAARRRGESTESKWMTVFTGATTAWWPGIALAIWVGFAVAAFTSHRELLGVAVVAVPIILVALGAWVLGRQEKKERAQAEAERSARFMERNYGGPPENLPSHVWEVLEEARGPASTERVVGEIHGYDAEAVEAELESLRRLGDVIRDDEGKWSLRGMVNR
jgi:hypothetical protein